MLPQKNPPFFCRQKKEEDDIVDSDFSIDENDEPVSDHGDEEGTKRRRKVGTKAYTEPSAKKAKPAVKPRENKPKPKPNRKAKRSSGRSTYTVMDSGRISVRKSTALKTSATQQRVKVRVEAQRKKPKISKYDDYVPTQDELLDEAMITAEENLASLGGHLKDS